MDRKTVLARRPSNILVHFLASYPTDSRHELYEIKLRNYFAEQSVLAGDINIDQYRASTDTWYSGEM